MKKRSVVKNVALLLILSLVITGTLFAAGGAEKPKATSAQKELTIFARTGPDSSDWLRTVATSFTAETGIKVNFIEQGQSGYFTNLTNQLVAGTDTFDLAVTNSTYIGPWAYAGYLAPLEPYMKNFNSNFDWKDMAFSYKIEGNTYAIPYSISSHILYYRSDLISEKELPQTWEEYIELAKKNTQSINPNAKTKYGTCWTAQAGPQQPKVFYNLLWSLGGEIDVNGKSTVASEAGLQAARYIEEMVKLGITPPEIANYSYPECLDALLVGTCAMAAPYWSAAYSDIQKSNSPYKDVIKVAMLPGAKSKDGTIKKVSFNHAYTLVLNAKAPNAEAAMKYYEYLCNKEMQLAYAKANGVPARYSALKDPNLNRAYFDVILESLEKTRFEPLVPYYLEQHDIMNNYLSAIMTGVMSSDKAMKLAQEELNVLYSEY